MTWSWQISLDISEACAGVEFISEVSNLSRPKKRSSPHCLINGRSLIIKEGMGSTQAHLQQMLGRKKEWEVRDSEGEPPGEVAAKWYLAVWKSVLGRKEKDQVAWLKVWGFVQTSKRNNKVQVRWWSTLSVWLYYTFGNIITKGRTEVMSTLADRLMLMGCNIQKRPLPGQEREEILKWTAGVPPNFFASFFIFKLL